jgi:NAD(P)H dehydrogenase (quinone)
MKHAIIVAHPLLQSFNMSVVQAYADAARAIGHDVLVRDLYRMNFSPCLHADEFPWSHGFAPRPDVVAERALLDQVDVYAFVYPLWLNAPPAMLKGYMDRVFAAGNGYARANVTAAESPRKRRKMISFTSSGAPHHWVVNTGAFEATRKLSDEHFSAVCGFEFLEHVHFGGIIPGIRGDVVAQKLAIVRSTVAKYFELQYVRSGSM